MSQTYVSSTPSGRQIVTESSEVVRNVGGPLGVRSALAAGTTGSSGLSNEIAAMHREAIHLLIGTPAKVGEVMSSRGGLSGSEVRLLIVSKKPGP